MCPSLIKEYQKLLLCSLGNSQDSSEVIMLPLQPFILISTERWRQSERSPAGDLLTILEDKPNGRRAVEGISLVAKILMMMMMLTTKIWGPSY